MAAKVKSILLVSFWAAMVLLAIWSLACADILIAVQSLGGNQAPTITSDGGGATAAVDAAENQTGVTDVQSTDDSDSEGSGLTYTITAGADQGLFSVNSSSGVLTFDAAPDYETPGDADQDNDYEVTVTVTDSGALTDSQAITVTVTDVDESAGNAILPQTVPGHLPPTGWDGTADRVLTDATTLASVMAEGQIDTSSGMYILELTSGDQWDEFWHIPDDWNSGQNWIVVRCSNYGNLPAAGNRLQPSPTNDADMAVVVGSTTGYQRILHIACANDGAGGDTGANKICFVGIQFEPGIGVYQYANVRCGLTPVTSGDTFPTNEVDLCSDLVFYQCRFTTPDSPSSKTVRDTMLRLDGDNCVVSCCDFYVRKRAFSSPDDGAMGLRIISGTGHRVYNNRLEAGGMSIFLGDNNPPTHGREATDVTIDHNLLTRNMSLRGTEAHKNPFEVKGFERVDFTSNIVENSWQGGGSFIGPGIVLKSQSSYSRDFTCRYNLFRNLGSVLLIEGATEVGVEALTRVKIHDNLWMDVDYAMTNDTGHILEAGIGQISSACQDIKLLSNTFVATDGNLGCRLHTTDPQEIAGMVWTDNVLSNTAGTGYYEFLSTQHGNGVEALNGDCDDYDLQYNVFTRFPAADMDNSGTPPESGSTLANNYFPSDESSIGFDDAAGDDYRISSGTYSTASSTGGPVGADIDAIETAVQYVETGTIP